MSSPTTKPIRTTLTKNPTIKNIPSDKNMTDSNINFDLLKEMCGVFAPTGNEAPMKEFILNFVKENQIHF